MTSYDMGAGGDKQDTAAFGTGGPSGFVNDTGGQLLVID
jgi:hypothetical protein